MADPSSVRLSLDATLHQLRTYVPAMAPFFGSSVSLRQHSAGLCSYDQPAPAHRDRLDLLVRSAQQVCSRTFGPNAGLAALVRDDLRRVNIVDHHQLLNHPLLLGTNVIANADRLLRGDDNRPIVTFSCSNVTPGNYYMRSGFQFRGIGVNYFSASERHHAMYYTDARRFDFVERLHATGRWSRFAPEDRNFLQAYQDLLNELDIAHTDRHRDQLAIAVRRTWPLLFDSEFRDLIPELLYLNSEEVATHCLLELLAGENYLSESIFNERLRSQILDEFRGVPVAWDEKAERGTHFFWRRHPYQPRLLRMYVEDDHLVPTDQRVRELAVPLRRETICDLLRSNELLPSVSSCVSLFLYAGMQPLVGPGSLVYFSRMQQGWQQVLTRNGLHDEADLVGSVDTGGLIAGAPLFFAKHGAVLRAQYGADVMADGGVTRAYLGKAFNAGLSDVLSVGASGVYDLFVNSYIPPELRLTDRLGFDEAATVVHEWI